MRQRTAGTIAELWRYPVKSMLGEQRSQLAITPRGSLGDRAKALRDLNTGRIASAKNSRGSSTSVHGTKLSRLTTLRGESKSQHQRVGPLRRRSGSIHDYFR